MKSKIFIPIILIILTFAASWIFFNRNVYAGQNCPGQLDCGITSCGYGSEHTCCPRPYKYLCTEDCRCYEQQTDCKHGNRIVTGAAIGCTPYDR